MWLIQKHQNSWSLNFPVTLKIQLLVTSWGLFILELNSKHVASKVFTKLTLVCGTLKTFGPESHDLSVDSACYSFPGIVSSRLSSCLYSPPFSSPMPPHHHPASAPPLLWLFPSSLFTSLFCQRALLKS